MLNTLKKGDILHTFGISDYLAHTIHGCVKATGVLAPDGRMIFTHNKKGAKKKFLLKSDMGSDTLAFVGDIPFMADSDTSKWSGSATLNLVGDAAVIKDWILTKNLNPNFTGFDKVMIANGHDTKPLFDSTCLANQPGADGTFPACTCPAGGHLTS